MKGKLGSSKNLNAKKVYKRLARIEGVGETGAVNDHYPSSDGQKMGR